jgi:hypothetical protein
MITRKPALTPEMVDEINGIIAANPTMGRSWVSQEICRRWGWLSANGEPKDIAARDMLRALDKAGRISLPAPQSASRRGPRGAIKHIEHNATVIAGGLGALRPLAVEAVESGAALAEFKSMLDQYHYLKFSGTVGENMKYAVRGRDGAVLACLLFGSAAWKCRDRDSFIGWSQEQRAARLHMLTNNARFLIPPMVSVPHLASHALSLVTRRLSADWEAKYGHPLLAVETFVERGRFRGTAYRAANWICVGRTAGRGRDGGHHNAVLPEKDIYLYPLSKDFREKLRGAEL